LVYAVTGLIIPWFKLFSKIYVGKSPKNTKMLVSHAGTTIAPIPALVEAQ
jgi:hypothetical protein